MYVKINKANTEEKEKFNAGQVTDADSTIHAQAKRVFKDMEDGTLQLRYSRIHPDVNTRRIESDCAMGTIPGSLHQEAGGDIREAQHPFRRILGRKSGVEGIDGSGDPDSGGEETYLRGSRSATGRLDEVQDGPGDHTESRWVDHGRAWTDW